MKHQAVAFLPLLLLLGCPKTSEVSPAEKERVEALKELMEEDEEFFDDIPEAQTEEDEEE